MEDIRTYRYNGEEPPAEAETMLGTAKAMTDGKPHYTQVDIYLGFSGEFIGDVRGVSSLAGESSDKHYVSVCKTAADLILSLHRRDGTSVYLPKVRERALAVAARIEDGDYNVVLDARDDLAESLSSYQRDGIVALGIVP